MANQFRYFVIFAQMRTGSNLLESNLNQFADLDCLGEAFNPSFIGSPNKTDLLGIDQDTRDADPMVLLTALRRKGDTIKGFRYFKDHDPRIFDAIMDDPTCDKIFLYRNPVDSYVSLKIARETDQWRLTNITRQKSDQIRFKSGEFDAFLDDFQGFITKPCTRFRYADNPAFRSIMTIYRIWTFSMVWQRRRISNRHVGLRLGTVSLRTQCH